jgi:hypothetical protein
VCREKAGERKLSFEAAEGGGRRVARLEEESSGHVCGTERTF